MNEYSYLNEINSIDSELKRITAHTKILRTQKTKAMNGLHQYMVARNIEKVGNITIEKCAPKNSQRAKVKPKCERKELAINLFRQAGIPDPISFYNDFERTQKNTNQENNAANDDDFYLQPQKRKRGKKNQDTIDPFLGF